MEDNQLLMIVLAFVLGCMCSGMMKQMCGGGRLVEGSILDYLPSLSSYPTCSNGRSCPPISPHCVNGVCRVQPPPAQGSGL